MNALPTIPLVDLPLQHRRVAQQVQQAWGPVLERASFILGPQVDAFEKQFASYCQASQAVGVGNGTDALELALRGVGVGRGDEVIVPANTFVATAEAVLRAGATLRLVDCDEHYLIDTQDLARRLTPAVRAVIPVHLYGQTAPIEVIRSLVGPEVFIVEDAAQAQGARRLGRRAGSLGDVAATSFYPGKNLGAYGDGGAVITSSVRVAETVRALRNHGGVRKYEHSLVGTNSRLDSLQAAVLSIKLEVLDDWNAERRAAAEYYNHLLADVPGVETPATLSGNEHVWHLYVVRAPHRDEVISSLNGSGIGAGIHYPTAVHLLPAFSFLGHRRGEFPRAEALAEQILTLPLFPGMTAQQQERVVSALKAVLCSPLGAAR